MSSSQLEEAVKDTQFEHEVTQNSHAHSKTYVNGVKAINAAKLKREQTSYGAMVMAAGMAGGYGEDGKPGRVTAFARNFCILFAFAAPNLLFIKYVL